MIAFCDECEKQIPIYPSVPEGYISPEPWSVQNAAVMGINGYRVVKKTLCRECYIEAHKRVYKEDISKKLPKAVK